MHKKSISVKRDAVSGMLYGLIETIGIRVSDYLKNLQRITAPLIFGVYVLLVLFVKFVMIILLSVLVH